MFEAEVIHHLRSCSANCTDMLLSNLFSLNFVLAAPQPVPKDDPTIVIVATPNGPVPPPPGVSVPVITVGPSNAGVTYHGKPCKRVSQNLYVDGIPLSKVISIFIGTNGRSATNALNSGRLAIHLHGTPSMGIIIK